MAQSEAVAIVVTGRPATANKKTPRWFKEKIEILFRSTGREARSGQLYGIVYYFVRGYRPAVHADADNLSKPVWDSLTGIAYADDKAIRLRTAGVIDLKSQSPTEITLEEIDMTNVPEDALGELLSLIAGTEEHILYIELGPANSKMFSFNLCVGGMGSED